MIQADIVGASESSLGSSGQSGSLPSHVDMSDQLWFLGSVELSMNELGCFLDLRVFLRSRV